MTDMHTALVKAEIRRALDKAAWYDRRGEQQRALAYRSYAKRLETYPPATADRVAQDASQT